MSKGDDDAVVDETRDDLCAQGMLRCNRHHHGTTQFCDYPLTCRKPFGTMRTRSFAEQRSFEVNTERNGKSQLRVRKPLSNTIERLAVEVGRLSGNGGQPGGHPLTPQCLGHSPDIAVGVDYRVIANAVDLGIDEPRCHDSIDDVIGGRCVAHLDDGTLIPLDGRWSTQFTFDQRAGCREALDHPNYCMNRGKFAQPFRI